MGSTEVDQLAINTIRVLAVSCPLNRNNPTPAKKRPRLCPTMAIADGLCSPN
jgi:hypothetical protein